MANKGGLRDSDVPDTCAVCMEHLIDRNPKFLSCHHSFCQQCLQKLTNNSQVSCPTCRAVTAVPNNDVTNLPMNFHFVQIMEREQEIPVQNNLGNLFFKIESPDSIKALEPDSFVYSDNKSNRFVVFNKERTVKRCFEGQKEHGEVRCVDVYKNQLYLAQEKQITCITNFDTEMETKVTFLPDIESLCRMAVANDKILVCTDYNKGEVYEYNTEDDTKKIVLQGLEYPTYISVDHTPDGARYILTLGVSANRPNGSVEIYNESWLLVKTISQGIRGQCDTAPCPGGFLLANYYRNEISMCSYTEDQVKTKTVLKDISNPISLTLKPPYLWIGHRISGNGKIASFRIMN